MSSIKAQTLKGFRDFLPAEERKRQYVINTLKGVFESYGFEPLETPALEYEEVLLGKYGDEGDKLMYRFEDNGGRKVALRYDQTVPLSRVVAQYQNQLPNPFKRYQIQPVWRAENPQKGRFREFLQCDADIVGTSSPLSDAEIIALAAKSVEQLGFKNFKILINDRGIFTTLKLGSSKLDKETIAIIRVIDKLTKIGIDGVVKELIKKGFSVDESRKILEQINTQKKTENIKSIFSYLEKLGLNESQYEFKPTLARGLDYYTGMIFEIEIEGYTAGSVCGGGRYDNLIGLFADRQIPAVGFAYGFDRIMEAIEEIGIQLDIKPQIDVLVTIFNEELKDKSLEITQQLREENIKVEIYLGEDGTKLEKQLKYADQKGIPYVAIIGPEEAAQGKITLKDLRNQQQQTTSIDDIIQKLI